MNCYEVTLNVWAGNASAEKFYEKMRMKTKERQMEYILIQKIMIRQKDRERSAAQKNGGTESMGSYLNTGRDLFEL